MLCTKVQGSVVQEWQYDPEGDRGQGARALLLKLCPWLCHYLSVVAAVSFFFFLFEFTGVTSVH